MWFLHGLSHRCGEGIKFRKYRVCGRSVENEQNNTKTTVAQNGGK